MVLCPWCELRPLASEDERACSQCYVCRRAAILLGAKGGPNMVAKLTDEQIARLFTLTGNIAAIRRELPAPPRGMETSLETAKTLRSSLEKHNDELVELAALLRG